MRTRARHREKGQRPPALRQFMLVIGSRAMRRAFGGAREALDWDVVAAELYAGGAVRGGGGESSERRAVDDALRALCTREMGRSVRIALAPHAEAVRRSVAPGFSVALLERANATGDDVALSLAPGPTGSPRTMSDRYLNPEESISPCSRRARAAAAPELPTATLSSRPFGSPGPCWPR